MTFKVVETKGNVIFPNTYFDTKSEVPLYVAQGCNALGIMGGGLALHIKHNYIDSYKEYYDYCIKWGKSINLLGTNSIFYYNPLFCIVNCITQHTIGTDTRKTNYEAVSKCFENLIEHLKQQHGNAATIAIAIPKLFGCGLGGGNWEIVKTIITQTLSLSHLNLTLYIVEYK